MTIHPDWARSIKQRYPNCFTPTPPPDYNAKCGIIDGHIQLMGAYHVESWDHFLKKQFAAPINRLFATGCNIVVLLFDNRMAVSPYKGMTQYKRCTRYQEVAFTNADQLPVNIPSPLTDYMMNRHFKDKVIAFVCERIQELVQPSETRNLIVDFKGPPKLYTSPRTCPADIPGLTELGESDVKFARYVQMLGNSIVYATDGDYLAISLLYYTVFGRTANNHILIYRQTATVAGSTAAKGKPTKSASAAAPAARKGRPMEYVHMQEVFSSILHATRHTASTAPESVVLGFVSMMLLAGTDYSRGLPMVGPKRLLEIAPLLVPSMQSSLMSTETKDARFDLHPDPLTMAATLVVSIYARIFDKHAHAPCATEAPLDSLLATLQASKLADRTKKLLPSAKQVDATCRNVCWVVHYWRDCINAQPDSSAPHAYGFAYNPSTRQYTWSDLLLPPDTSTTEECTDHVTDHAASKGRKRTHTDSAADVDMSDEKRFPLASHPVTMQVDGLQQGAAVIASITRMHTYV